jgi:hypothetical protein
MNYWLLKEGSASCKWLCTHIPFSDFLSSVRDFRISLRNVVLSHGLLSGRTRSCQRLPSYCVSFKLSDETLWLRDSHFVRVLAGRLSGWDTSLWLGHCSNAQSYENLHMSHSSTTKAIKLLIQPGKIPRKKSSPVYGVRVMHILRSHSDV